jgi:hypothetical protein
MSHTPFSKESPRTRLAGSRSIELSRRSVLFLGAALACALAIPAAAGRYVEVEYPPSAAPSELQVGVTYILWIPALAPEAQKRLAEARSEARHPADRPQNLSPQERCIFSARAGPPMLAARYNNNYQIVQTPAHVLIFVEEIHDVRIIPLDGRPHLPSNIRKWVGDSSGHWEGDTLVVDTTNFTSKTKFRGTGENLHLIERFTRIRPDTILYKFTIDDPSTLTRAWTAESTFAAVSGRIYEYACHEGNYAMVDILRGARLEDQAADAKKGSGER